MKTLSIETSKARIIERVLPNGETKYVIQQRHFLFKWWWVDAWLNSDVSCRDSFPTLEEAKKNICHFDGTKQREKIIMYSNQGNTITLKNLD